MTREEAIAIIRKEYLCVDRDCDIERSCGKCDLVIPSKEPILEAYKMAIKALEQEPCEDAINRKAVIDTLDNMDKALDTERTVEEYKALSIECYKVLPPVTPKQRTGHWEENVDNSRRWDRRRFYCSECGNWQTYGKTDFCPSCGAKMIEPQESEE